MTEAEIRKSRKEELNERLSGAYEIETVNGMPFFKTAEGGYFRLDSINDPNCIMVEHAENRHAAEMNWLEDGDLLYLDEMDLEAMYLAIVNEVEGA